MLVAAGALGADEPWSLEEQLQTPDWLSVRGSYRARYERLANTFRVLDPGSDQILVSRLLVALQATGEKAYAGVELQDSRAWLHETLSPVGTDDVNAAELLRAYVGWKGENAFTPGDRLDLTLGRITIDLGSRRLVARNRFRNTSNAFTGIHALWMHPGKMAARAFYTLPVARLPSILDSDRLRDNKFDFDEESFDVTFWGIDASDLKFADRVAGEFYLLGLREDDQVKVPSRNRDLLTAGFRCSSDREPWRLEIESVYQYGHSRATPLAIDQRDLDHRAWFAHVHAVRRFAERGMPMVILQYDYASGDRDPADGRNERFDTLYGARRFEFGPTGIYGALARGNINSPGIGFGVQPSAASDLVVGYRAAWLASRTDALVTTGLRDRAGKSGTFVGHQFELRLRWALLPGNLVIEAGGAYLAKGEFLKRAPLAPPGSDTVYGYSQVVFSF